MWAYVKNLKSTRKEFLLTEDLFIIEEKREGWTRKKFNHSSLDQVDHEREKYGRLDGTQITRVLILQMANSKSELERLITLVRPKEPVRHSLSEIAVNLRAFLENEEANAAKGQGKDGKKQPAKKKDEKKDKNKKTDVKKQNDEKQPTKKKANIKKTDENEEPEEEKVKEKNETDGNKTDIDEGSGEEDESSGVETGVAEKNGMDGDNETAFMEIDGGENGEESLNGHDESTVEELRRELNEVKEKLQHSQMEVVRLQMENKMLWGQNKTLSKITKEIKKLPAQMGNVRGHKVKSVTPEEDFKDIKWDEETHIYVGCGRVVARQTFDDIDDTYTSFNTRALNAINAILGDNLKNFSKSGTGKDEAHLKKIPDLCIVALRRVLRGMSWGSPDDYSEAKLKAFLNKQPHEERRKLTKKENALKTGKKSKTKKRQRSASEESSKSGGSSSHSE